MSGNHPPSSNRSPSGTTAAASKGTLTPMMAQYQLIKEKYPDILLFYRMGDFYEMFFHDAVVGSAALGIALTHRGKQAGQDIPMCGVPVHAMDSYLPRLIQKGHRVALCEQTDTPENFKKKGGKGPLPRDVVRVFTPGTLHEEGLLVPDKPNYLVAIGRANGKFAIAWADMSTASFSAEECDEDAFDTTLARLGMAELIYPADCEDRLNFQNADISAVSCPSSYFDSRRNEDRLKAFYGLKSLDGFGSFSPAILSAAGGLLSYLQATQLSQMPRLKPLSVSGAAHIVQIDAATRRSLEIVQTLSGEKKGSLLSAIDRTRTAAGARLLYTRLAAPLTDKAQIDKRLELAGWFCAQTQACHTVSEQLASLSDLERALSRLAAGRGGPRDLSALAEGLAQARQIYLGLEAVSPALDADNSAYQQIMALARVAANPSALADKIQPALSDQLPLLARDGQFIRAGYSEQLDHLRELRDESRRLMAGLQAQYAEQTAIASLKVKHNNVLGYHIDVRSAHADKLMSDPSFIHRQTTAQAVRFTTAELGELEQQLSSAADRALALEIELFDMLTADVTDAADEIASAAEALAQLDVAQSTAHLALTYGYTRPTLCDDTNLLIEGGRHPVVEQMLEADESFIANDCLFDDISNLWLLTGPNMAGKSTFLRQNAHIVILAQAGLYVPAASARIGIVDRVFSRVGASDDLARGQSTFMVEMVETAAILNQSTSHSLVILDEIGRGTATWDGLAIAWACLEYLHNHIGCRTLFATHYHELTHLEAQLDRLSCHAMAVREWQQNIVFLHQVISGSADKSYGVHVARLAGLPDIVTGRAARLVSQLEQQAQPVSGEGVENGSGFANQDMLPLFSAPEPLSGELSDASDIHMPERLNALLSELEPDALSPREALDWLYQLRDVYDNR